jgi:hypothetical protein
MYSIDSLTTTHNILRRKPKKLILAPQDMPMNMAMQAAPPRRPPVSPQKRSVVSPRKKQRSFLSTTPRSSRLAISTIKNTYIDGPDDEIGFSEKNAPFRSFSELCLDDLFDKGEEEEKESQKEDFMPSMVDFHDSDNFLDDSKFKKMCTEWQLSADAVAGGTKEKVEFNTHLASLFGCLTDILANKRAFDKKECSTLQQEMERLKKVLCRMVMSAEPSRSSEIESGGEPVTPRSRSPTRPSQGSSRSPESSSHCLHKSDDDDASEQLHQSGSTDRRETSAERRHRRSKASGSKATEHSSPVRNSPKGVSPRRTVTPSPGELSSLILSSRHPSKQRDPMGHSSCHSQSPRKRSELAAVLHTPSSMKGDSMSSLDVSSRTSRSMPVPLSPRKSTRTSGQSDKLHSLITPRKGDSMSLLNVSSHTSRSMPASLSPRKSSRTSGQDDPMRSSTTPRRLRSGASSSVKSIKSPRKSLHKDPRGVSESSRAVQLHGTPRRSTEKVSTGRISAGPKQSPTPLHHLARLHGCSGLPDSATTVSSRSSPGVRPRAQSQTPRRALLHQLDIFSNCDDLVLAPTAYFSTEKEDAAPRQPSRGGSTDGSGGRRSSQERQPISRNRAHSVAPVAERKSLTSSRGCSDISTSGTSLSRRRSRSVAPETGSSRVRSNSVTLDAKKSSGRSDIFTRSENRFISRPSLSSIVYVD